MVTVNVVSNTSICMENIGNKKKSKKTIQIFAHLVDVLRESPTDRRRRGLIELLAAAKK